MTYIVVGLTPMQTKSKHVGVRYHVSTVAATPVRDRLRALASALAMIVMCAAPVALMPGMLMGFLSLMMLAVMGIGGYCSQKKRIASRQGVRYSPVAGCMVERAYLDIDVMDSDAQWFDADWLSRADSQYAMRVHSYLDHLASGGARDGMTEAHLAQWLEVESERQRKIDEVVTGEIAGFESLNAIRFWLERSSGGIDQEIAEAVGADANAPGRRETRNA